MLSREHQFIAPCYGPVRDNIMDFLRKYDLVEGTIFSIEFEYIYIVRETYTFRQLSNILGVSLASLYRHIRKLRFMVVKLENRYYMEMRKK